MEDKEQEKRKELLKKWKELPEPKDSWETFKRKNQFQNSSFKEYYNNKLSLKEVNTGLDTTWQDEGITITLQDVLDIADAPIEVDPNELEPLLIKTKRDPARVQAADLEHPIVVTTLNGQYKSILDGQHRIVKASEYNALNPDNKVSIKTRILNLDTAPEEYQQMFA
jgi:hypothetical protein